MGPSGAWISIRLSVKGSLLRTTLPEVPADMPCSSRDYTCPVCQAKNIELLPDTDVDTESSKAKGNPVKLSFGYKGEITPSNEDGIAVNPILQADSKQIRRRNRIQPGHSLSLSARRRGLIAFSFFSLSSLPLWYIAR